MSLASLLFVLAGVLVFVRSVQLSSLDTKKEEMALNHHTNNEMFERRKHCDDRVPRRNAAATLDCNSCLVAREDPEASSPCHYCSHKTGYSIWTRCTSSMWKCGNNMISEASQCQALTSDAEAIKAKKKRDEEIKKRVMRDGERMANDKFLKTEHDGVSIIIWPGNLWKPEKLKRKNWKDMNGLTGHGAIWFGPKGQDRSRSMFKSVPPKCCGRNKKVDLNTLTESAEDNDDWDEHTRRYLSWSSYGAKTEAEKLMNVYGYRRGKSRSNTWLQDHRAEGYDYTIYKKKEGATEPTTKPSVYKEGDKVYKYRGSEFYRIDLETNHKTCPLNKLSMMKFWDSMREGTEEYQRRHATKKEQTHSYDFDSLDGPGFSCMSSVANVLLAGAHPKQKIKGEDVYKDRKDDYNIPFLPTPISTNHIGGWTKMFAAMLYRGEVNGLRFWKSVDLMLLGEILRQDCGGRPIQYVSCEGTSCELPVVNNKPSTDRTEEEDGSPNTKVSPWMDDVPWEDVKLVTEFDDNHNGWQSEEVAISDFFFEDPL